MRFADDKFEIGRLRLPDAEIMAVLNWETSPRDFVLPLHRRSRVTELWSGRDLGDHERSLTFKSVPSHSGRLFRVTPEP
jgi:hypothetical protein